MRSVRIVSNTIGGISLAIAALACGSDTAAPRTNFVHEFWSLTLNYEAVTLSTTAPYDTVRLIPTPRDANGVPLSDPATIHFKVGDGTDTTVLISDDGVVTARAFARSIPVIATVTVNGVTRSDTATINVDTGNPTLPEAPLTTFSIQPFDGPVIQWDCSRSDFYTINPTVIDAGGNQRYDLNVVYSSTDPSVAKVEKFSGLVIPNCITAVGKSVWIRATSTVYGVTYMDSVQFIPTVPTAAFILMQPGIDNNDNPVIALSTSLITIGTGGDVAWVYVGDPIPSTGIAFDNPSAITATTDTVFNGFFAIPPSGAGGDIPEFIPDGTIPFTDPAYVTVNMRIRHFPVAGEYHFHSTRFPTITGIVRVVDTDQ